MGELGSCRYQVTRLFNESGINCIGQSKHNAKLLQRSIGAKTVSEVHKGIGIYGINTAIKYQKVWRQAFTHAKDNYGIKDIRDLNAKHINSFLKSHYVNEKKTLNLYISALNKLETSLQLYSKKEHSHRNYNFQNVLTDARVVSQKKSLITKTGHIVM